MREAVVSPRAVPFISVPPRPRRDRVAAPLLASWLVGLLLAPTLFESVGGWAQQTALVWALPLMAVLYGGGFLRAPVFRRKPAVLAWAGAFVVSLLPGSMLSIDPETSLMFVGATLLAVIMVAGAWEIGDEEIRRAIAIYSVIGMAWTVLVVVFFYETGERLGGFQGPNTLALMELGIAMASLCLKRRLLTGAVLGVSLFAIIASGSRTGLFATLAMLGVFALLSLRRPTTLQVVCGAGMAAGVIVGAVYAMDDLHEWGITFLAIQVGSRTPLDSGFTGRLYAWQEAIDLWRTHPFLGVGYRLHEQHFSGFSSAHNGYLATLAEVGLVGVIPLSVLLGLAISRTVRWVRSRDALGKVALAFFVGMALEAGFERYLINIGNPTSILILLFLFRPGLRPARTSASPEQVADARHRERAISANGRGA